MSNGAEKKKDPSDLSSFFAVALFTIMLVAIMILSAFSGTLFEHININRLENINDRAALSYIAAHVTAVDDIGGVSLDKDKKTGGDILVLSGSNGRNTLLYLEDGYLMEFNRDGKGAEKVAAISKFEVSIENSIVTVTTDQGTRLIYLHAGEAVT